MDERKKLLIYLSYHEISNKKQEELLERLEDFSLKSAISSSACCEILSFEERKRLQDNLDERALDLSIANMQSHEIQIVTIFDSNFPYKFFSLPDRPLILYAKGDLNLLDEQCFGIVGTRSPTSYGKIITENFASKLAESGLVIVSGLCYGVDAIAHRATLKVGGKTAAIIGSGLDQIYPSTNTALAEEIIEKGGVVLTEYPPSFHPKRYTFPRRNRLVAGISDGILITEAGLKSGTTHTKEFALAYGKDVFTIPGNINSEKSDLPNSLIKSGQASCALSADDILEYYGLKGHKQEKIVTLNFEEQEIVKILEKGESTFEILSNKTKMPANLLSSHLTTLEIRGIIRKLPAQTYALL